MDARLSGECRTKRSTERVRVFKKIQRLSEPQYFVNGRIGHLIRLVNWFFPSIEKRCNARSRGYIVKKTTNGFVNG